MAANDAAIEVRRSAKQREQEEVEAILAYQAMKVFYRRYPFEVVFDMRCLLLFRACYK